MRRTFGWRGLGGLMTVMAVALTTAGPAYAQLPPSSRPYRALFSPNPDPNSRQSLDVSGSLVGGYDDNVLAATRSDALGIPLSSKQQGGFASGFGGVSYAFRFPSFNLSARTMSSLRYYPDLGTTTSYHAASVSAAGSMQPWARGTLSLGGTVWLGSDNRLTLLDVPEGKDGFLDQQDYAVRSHPVVRYTANTSLNHQFNPRTSLHFAVAGTYANAVTTNYSTVYAAAQVRHQISRNGTVYVGYGLRQALYSGGGLSEQRGKVHSIDAGVSYGRALSLTRHTTLGFSTGSAIIAPTLTPDQQNSSLHAQVTGSVALTHELGRSWETGVTYNRSVRFIEEFTDPILSNSVYARIAGYLRPRLDLSGVVGYSSGAQAARTSGGRVYDTSTSSVQLRYGFTRFVSLYTQYLFYRYTFDSSVVLVQEVPRKVDRQDIRAGISFSAPLLR